MSEVHRHPSAGSLGGNSCVSTAAEDFAFFAFCVCIYVYVQIYFLIE